MKKIPLKGKYGLGQYAIVDDNFFEHTKNSGWYLTAKGYVCRREKKGEYKDLATRSFIYLSKAVLEVEQNQIVDHINHNKLDNRKSNLRKASQQQNIFNRRKLSGSKNCTSKYKGVMLRPYNRWESAIKKDGKITYIGSFSTPEEAALAYNQKAQELFGEFAYLNSV